MVNINIDAYAVFIIQASLEEIIGCRVKSMHALMPVPRIIPIVPYMLPPLP